MELALNLVWAILAVASYAVLFRHLITRTEDARRPSRRQCVIALTCVLAILFPVISLTDDLHEIQATAEDASAAAVVIKRCVARQSSASARSFHQAFLIFAPFVSAFRQIDFGVLAVPRLPSPSPGLPLPSFGRAPPSFSVSPNA